MNKANLIIILAVMILIGLFGNAINIIVLSRKTMRNIATFRLLLFLSLLDFLVLIICASDTLLSFGFEIDFRIYSTFICRIHMFLTYFLTHTSSIVLTLISIERVCVVYDFDLMTFFRIRSENNRKLKFVNVYRDSTIKRINESNSIENTEYENKNRFIRFLQLNRIDLIVFLIMIVILIMNLHFLIFFNLIEMNLTFETNNLDILSENMTNISTAVINRSKVICSPVLNSRYENFLKHIWTWLDVSIYSFVPFMIMFVSSIMILLKINKTTSSFLNSLVNKNNNFNRKITKRRLKKNKQMSLMLFLNNIYFAVCTIPFFVIYNLNRGHYFDENNYYEGLFAFVQILSYSNNSINFIFFGIFSHKYRNEFFTVFRLK